MTWFVDEWLIPPGYIEPNHAMPMVLVQYQIYALYAYNTL